MRAPSAAAEEAVEALRAARAASGACAPFAPDAPADAGAPDAATAWDEPRGLTNTERHEMDQLREKYGAHQRARDARSGDARDAEEEAIRAAQAEADAEFRARPVATAEDRAARRSVVACFACQGQRTIKEEYNHRVMERMCDRCDGEGVLVDGAPLPEGSSERASSRPSSSNPSPFAPGAAASVRVATLERDARRVDAKAKRYDEESAAMMRRLEEAGGGGGPGGRGGGGATRDGRGGGACDRGGDARDAEAREEAQGEGGGDAARGEGDRRESGAAGNRARGPAVRGATSGATRRDETIPSYFRIIYTEYFS